MRDMFQCACINGWGALRSMPYSRPSGVLSNGLYVLYGAKCRALQPQQPGNRAYLGAYSSADIPADPLEASAGDTRRCTASLEQEVVHPKRNNHPAQIRSLAISGWVMSAQPNA